MLARSASALQLQGPKSGEIMHSLFGDRINDLRYYWFADFELDGMPLIISRTGWSSELGYEIYLRDGSRGDELWERLMQAGQPFGLQPGHTSAIRRIEGGMLSYHADMDSHTNPFELGLDRLVDLEMEADFIGKAALTKIAEQGVSRKQVTAKNGTEKMGLARTLSKSRDCCRIMPVDTMMSLRVPPEGCSTTKSL